MYCNIIGNPQCVLITLWLLSTHYPCVNKSLCIVTSLVTHNVCWSLFDYSPLITHGSTSREILVVIWWFWNTLISPDDCLYSYQVIKSQLLNLSQLKKKIIPCKLLESSFFCTTFLPEIRSLTISTMILIGINCRFFNKARIFPPVNQWVISGQQSEHDQLWVTDNGIVPVLLTWENFSFMQNSFSVVSLSVTINPLKCVVYTCISSECSCLMADKVDKKTCY